MIGRQSLLTILELNPIDACVQMSSQLPHMTLQDLHAELPYVIRRIFGFTRFDWSLRDICYDRSNVFSIMQEFLSPWHGELWKALVRLQEHSSSFSFQFQISDLPAHLRARMASFYTSDIVRGRTPIGGQSMTTLSLDPIEYFLFHLLSYGISDQHSSDRPLRSDSVYLTVLEMYLCLFLPIDADEFRLLLLPSSNASTTSSFSATTAQTKDPRLSATPSLSPTKKIPVRQSYLFGSVKARDNMDNQSMNISTSPTSSGHSTSPSIILSATTADTNELMKKIDYFIKCYVAFVIDIFQSTKSISATLNGSILVQEFNLSDVHLLCIRMFIKRLHLFCAYQIGIGGNNASLANTGLTLLEQRNLLVPLQTLKKTCIDNYVRLPLYTFLQIGIVRCPLDQRYNTLLFIWYTYIRPWRFNAQSQTPDHRINNLLDTTHSEQDSSTQDQSIMTIENLNFIERNLFFYGRLFQFAIDRFQKADLGNPLIAHLISKLANVFCGKNFSEVLLKAEQVSLLSTTTSSTPGKLRISPPSTPEGPRPPYSLFSDETRTLINGCLRKMSNVLRKNERRIEEKTRLTSQTLNNTSSSATGSKCLGDLAKSMLLKISLLDTQPAVKQNIDNTPLLSSEIIELLTNTKNKFMSLYRIDLGTFDTFLQDEESLLNQSFDGSMQLNRSLSRSIRGSPLHSSYCPYESENPILSPANPFELRVLLWFNQRISENLNLRYENKISALYNRNDFVGFFFRQLFYGPQDPLFHSIRKPQINFRHFTDMRTLVLLAAIYFIIGLFLPIRSRVIKIFFLLLIILFWNIVRTLKTYRQTIKIS